VKKKKKKKKDNIVIRIDNNENSNLKFPILYAVFIFPNLLLSFYDSFYAFISFTLLLFNFSNKWETCTKVSNVYLKYLKLVQSWY